MNWKTIFAAGAILLSGTLYAQTPDGVTPANEGICDELVGGTPGLYGLCIAFSAGQNCEPDFDLDNPFENCTPSGPKLVEIYNKKSEWWDPPMPGLGNPCPCWLPPELDGLRFPLPTIILRVFPSVMIPLQKAG